VNTKDSSFSLNEADKLSNSTDDELAFVSASITPSGVYSGKVIEYVGRVRFTVPAGVEVIFCASGVTSEIFVQSKEIFPDGV
jgi:hypothetical protein